MSATRFVEIVNASPDSVFLRIFAGGKTSDFFFGAGSRLDLAARPALPEVGDAAAFEQHRFEVQVGDRTFSLWRQAGSSAVRWSAAGWPADGTGFELAGSADIAVDFFLRLRIGEDGDLRAERVSAEALLAEPPAEAFDPRRQVAPADVPEGQYLDYLYGQLRRSSPEFENITFGKSGDNSLSGWWLLHTPNWMGKPARDLPDQHSQGLAERIREVIAGAELCVDIATLFPEPVDGHFLDGICRGIAGLIAKNRPIAVRFLVGNYPTKLADTEGLLKKIEARVPAVRGSKLQIYAAGLMVTALSWNHAKIVAADSRKAIVGGHNLWAVDYLCAAPVHDVSMQVDGPAARLAHEFCNRLWRHVSYWNRLAIGIYSNDYYGPTGRIGGNSLSEVRLVYETGPGKTAVLAVGRTGIMDGGRGNQSDQAFRLALALAKRSIKISQQDLLLILVADPLLLKELCAAILRDLPVSIVLSSPGATSGGGTGYNNAPLDVSVGAVVLATMALAEALGIPRDRAAALLVKNLRIAPIRFSADREWPADRRFQLCGQPRVARQIANHSKLWIVDDQLFYIGSQNFYPSDNQEFGYVVEGAVETAALLRDYWNPLWGHSSPAALAVPIGDDLTIRLADLPAVPPAADSGMEP